jgi:hypothetical protein
VGINSVAAADFETNPSDHCRVARTVPGSLWIVRNTIFVWYIFRIRAAAVTPFIPGILMSRRTISGLSLPTFSRASAPSRASPQTWKEFKFKSDRMAVRAAELSSTTSMRAGNLCSRTTGCGWLGGAGSSGTVSSYFPHGTCLFQYGVDRRRFLGAGRAMVEGVLRHFTYRAHQRLEPGVYYVVRPRR